MNPVKLKLSLYILAIRAIVSTLNRKFRTISSQKVVMVASMSIGLGLGVTVYPQIFQHLATEAQIILGNGVVVCSLAAVILNLIFNWQDFKKPVQSKIKNNPRTADPIMNEN